MWRASTWTRSKFAYKMRNIQKYTKNMFFLWFFLGNEFFRVLLNFFLTLQKLLIRKFKTIELWKHHNLQRDSRIASAVTKSEGFFHIKEYFADPNFHAYVSLFRASGSFVPKSDILIRMGGCKRYWKKWNSQC
jgi:hypothetical protein